MKIPIQGSAYRNKKNQKKYHVVGFATNATNAQDGQQMVIYRYDGNKNSILYVREINEFNEKFTLIQ